MLIYVHKIPKAVLHIMPGIIAYSEGRFNIVNWPKTVESEKKCVYRIQETRRYVQLIAVKTQRNRFRKVYLHRQRRNRWAWEPRHKSGKLWWLRLVDDVRSWCREFRQSHAVEIMFHPWKGNRCHSRYLMWHYLFK